MDAAHTRWQRAFAAYLRDPARHPLPEGVDPRGAATYRRLLLGNTERILGAVYPRARRLLGKTRWDELLTGFLAEAHCSSPFYRDVPGAFLDWLRPQQGALPAWLVPLLEHDWARFCLGLAPDAAWQVPLPGHAALNPVSRLCSHPLAVHRGDGLPEPRATHLLLFRGADDRVRIVELTPASIGLLQQLATGQPLQEACAALASELGLTAAAMAAHAQPLLHDLERIGAIRLGQRPDPN
ncbi:MAG: putative DNA-binding domain-containing protein [Pseudomonadota bacterium]